MSHNQTKKSREITKNTNKTSVFKVLLPVKPLCLERLNLTKSQEAVFAVFHFSQKNYPTITKSNPKIAEEACLFLVNSKETVHPKTVSRAVKKFSRLGIMNNEVDTRFMNTAERYILPDVFTDEEKIEVDLYFAQIRKLAKGEKKRYLSYFGNVPQYSVLTVDIIHNTLALGTKDLQDKKRERLINEFQKKEFVRKRKDDAFALQILQGKCLSKSAKYCLLRFPNPILKQVFDEMPYCKDIGKIYARCKQLCFEQGIVPDHMFSRSLEGTVKEKAFKFSKWFYIKRAMNKRRELQSKVPQRELHSPSLRPKPVVVEEIYYDLIGLPKEMNFEEEKRLTAALRLFGEKGRAAMNM
jgi:hypothetical protein